MAPVVIRPPTFSSAPAPTSFDQPTIQWLTETWHVTHSTLPMWKSKRNVRIQYTPLPPSKSSISADHTDRIDDLVTYQALTRTKLDSVRGIDAAASTPAGENTSRAEWNWRGKGLLKPITSHWEILGWGTEAETGHKWVVTMFAKTLFTPAGLDFYAQTKDGLHPATLADIQAALGEVQDDTVRKLAKEVFAVTIDDARTD